MGNVSVASFLDTVVYIEQTIAKAIGCVQIIDDLRPPVTASESATIAAKAEQIFRIFGDSNSKGRSSPSLQQCQTPAPACCGLITGEDIWNIFRPMDRGKGIMRMVSILIYIFWLNRSAFSSSHPRQDGEYYLGSGVTVKCI